MAEREPTWATWMLLTLIVGLGLTVTGLFPTEAQLSPYWWDAQAMAEGQWWRLVTSLFVHGGLLHLGFNAIALFSMRSLEREVGSVAFLAIFLSSGIAGNLAHVATSQIPVVGASGGIFGLLGVLLVLAPQLELFVLGLPVPAIVVLPLYMSVVLLVPAFSELMPIAHWAHLGGMLAGMVAGTTLAPRRALEHLAYIAVVFLATLGLVSWLQVQDPQALVGTFQQEGLLGLLVAMWPAWLALGVIVATLEVLEKGEESGRQAR